MPEGPEVALKAEEIWNFLKTTDKKLINIDCKEENGKSNKKYKIKDCFPLEVERVYARGKMLIWECKNNHGDRQYILIHLGMTGKFLYNETDQHSDLTFVFEHANIYFSDSRKFGSVEITDANGLQKHLKNHGPCLLTAARVYYENYKPVSELQEPATLAIWQKCLEKRNKKSRSEIYIADYLLEQKHTSGLGNYLRVEILYACKIHPLKTLKSLTDNEVTLLYNKSIEIIYTAWLCKGLGSGNNKGIKQQINKNTGYIIGGCFPLLVYGRKKDCKNNAVEKYTDKNKRTVHYVPNVQF